MKAEDKSSYGNKEGLVSNILPRCPRIPDLGMTAGFHEEEDITNLKFSWKSSHVSSCQPRKCKWFLSLQKALWVSAVLGFGILCLSIERCKMFHPCQRGSLTSHYFLVPKHRLKHKLLNDSFGRPKQTSNLGAQFHFPDI